MNWWKNLKGKVRRKELLKHHTTFKIGGPAEFFIEPKDISDLKLLLDLAKSYRISISVIGSGSNILVSDRGLKGIALRLSSPVFKTIDFKGNYCEVGAGVLLSQLLGSCQKRGLSGLEFLAGIPGTVAGALAMNSGAQGKNISDVLFYVKAMDKKGAIKILRKKEAKFGYRTSGLTRYIIISALIKLTRKQKESISKRIKQYLAYRKLTQDYTRPSAGCVFKNPPGHSAGKLIDLCGLKGKRIGGVSISHKHANFILNTGGAKATDVLKLMDFIRKKVKQTFRISLVPEIKIW
jgi:UDP-N-acetylmuramate dehydrogenase